MSGNTIIDYNSLITAVQDYLVRSDLTDSNYMPVLIQNAQNKVYHGFTDNRGNYWPGLRVRQMEKSFNGTLASNQIAVPSDYLEMKYLYLTVGGNSVRLERKPIEWIYSNYGPGYQDVPAYFGRDNVNFYCAPYSASAYSYNGVYYAKSTLLSSSNTTDWMVTNFPHMLLMGCLAEASEFLQVPNLAYWENAFSNAMAAIQAADTQEDNSGSPLAMVAQ
jgi:hypothetical protein